MVIEIFEIINIHGYHLALIELLDVLEYRMTYVDSIHIVPLKHHIEGVTRQWRPLLSLQHQASIPDRTTIAIEELAKFRLSLTLLAFLEKHTADRIVDHRNRKIALIKITADTGVNKEVATYHLHGIASAQPLAQLCIRKEEVSIRHAQLLCQQLVLRLGIAHIACQLHRLMVAQHHRYSTATFRSLSLQLVEQPEYLWHVIASIKNVTDDHQLIIAIRPSQLTINNTICLQKADNQIEAPMGIRHHEGLLRLTLLPLLANHRMKAYIERIIAFMVGYMKRKIVRQRGISDPSSG